MGCAPLLARRGRTARLAVQSTSNASLHRTWRVAARRRSRTLARFPAMLHAVLMVHARVSRDPPPPTKGCQAIPRRIGIASQHHGRVAGQGNKRGVKSGRIDGRHQVERDSPFIQNAWASKGAATGVVVVRAGSRRRETGTCSGVSWVSPRRASKVQINSVCEPALYDRQIPTAQETACLSQFARVHDLGAAITGVD